MPNCDAAVVPMRRGSDSGDGHPLVHRPAAPAVYLEIGSRDPDDVITCPGIDMTSPSGRFLHRDGTPYAST